MYIFKRIVSTFSYFFLKIQLTITEDLPSGRSTDRDILVNVVNVNDNKPIFDASANYRTETIEGDFSSSRRILMTVSFISVPQILNVSYFPIEADEICFVVFCFFFKFNFCQGWIKKKEKAVRHHM